MLNRSDLLLTGGRIYPLGAAAPSEAILLRDGRVAVLGSHADVWAAAPRGCQTIRLHGATVTPGFTDAHVHWTAWALARRALDLTDAPDIHVALNRVRGAAGSGDGWILGHGWDPHRWNGFPPAGVLDAAAPDRPVLLESRNMHSAWLNAEALRRCGVDRDTPNPPGGEIVRDPETGEPTGILLENARVQAIKHLPPPSMPEVLDALDDAQSEAHRMGITGVHNFEPEGLRHTESLRQAGRLRLRVLQHIPVVNLDAAIQLGLRSGLGGSQLRIGGVKVFLDGALGSCTAWLRKPYQGSTMDVGIQTLPSEEFRNITRRASAAGLAMTVHAIGDAAVELAIDVLGETPPPPGMPHRIEHIQLCPPEFWNRAAACGAVASVQPCHLPTDLHPAELHWGVERCRGAFPFGALWQRGMTLAFGSDVPVESIDPRLSLYAARARVGKGGEPTAGWHPEHRLTAEQTVRAFTEGPAVAAANARRQGRLLPGYDADLVAWSQDPMVASPEEVRDMRCLLTVVAGRVVHAALS